MSIYLRFKSAEQRIILVQYIQYYLNGDILILNYDVEFMFKTLLFFILMKYIRPLIVVLLPRGQVNSGPCHEKTCLLGLRHSRV